MPVVNNDTLLRYCNAVYDALLAGAHDGLWEGGITRLFASLGISNANYSKIMATLYEIGSIEQVRRGARGSLTVIRLHFRPGAEDLARAMSPTSRLTSPSSSDKLSQRLSVLEGRLQGIDFVKYIANTEKRLQKLEQLIKKEN